MLKSDPTLTPIRLDAGRQDRMFELYVQRVAALKGVAHMADSLINPLKIASLTALCILEAAPLVSPRQDSVIAAYRNSYYAFQVALNFLEIRRIRLDQSIQTHALNFLSHVQHVAERSGTGTGVRYDDFAYRFTIIHSFLATLCKGYNGQLTVSISSD
ncbi:hypothetical protein [Rhodospirillum centenum]|uniref:Uncharacterized protein n=1 Tax=Rhodospirillum centenum (strain ATCC 51521 / SW) TaxID=414684 RepID=B6IVG2_RHOCS|nr:hypothetical protein [Rhodospirillum centenum]ACJ00286.1 hypothetical protein RC1_2918 [Rhodospirillum centenum SW]